MIRIPYQQIAIELEKLYAQQIDTNDLQAVEEHCDYITQFIEACGWTVEEYTVKSLEDFTNPTTEETGVQSPTCDTDHEPDLQENN